MSTIYSTIIDTDNNPSKEMKVSKEYEEIDMFHTDKNIVKGHINLNFKKNNGEGHVPRPMLRDGCNQDEFRSFTLQWRLYAGGQGEMDDRELRRQLLSCIDGTLEDAMYDALGNKINTSTEADMMTELGKLAVDEQFTVEEIITVVEDMYMIHEEIPVKQSNIHRSQHHSSLAKQTPPRFEDPQMLFQQGQPRPAAGGSTEKVCPYTIPARRQTQLLTEEGQLTITVEEVLDSTPNMQMTITSTELLKGGRVPTLQEGQRGHHQHEEGQVCANLVGKPGPALQTVDATVDDVADAAADVDDNPLNEINAGHNRTVEEATITTPEEEPSTNSGGEYGKDKTALAAIRDEIIELRARMMMLETNQSNLLTRL